MFSFLNFPGVYIVWYSSLMSKVINSALRIGILIMWWDSPNSFWHKREWKPTAASMPSEKNKKAELPWSCFALSCLRPISMHLLALMAVTSLKETENKLNVVNVWLCVQHWNEPGPALAVTIFLLNCSRIFTLCHCAFIKQR